LEGLVGVVDGLEQEALLGVSGDDGGTFLAALEQAITIIEA